MATEVQYSNKAKKGKDNLTQDERDILDLLEQDLRETEGKPFGRGWFNIGPVKQLGNDIQHCHLHKRKPEKVVVWKVTKTKKGKETQCIVRIEYVGTREKAPF